MLGIFETTSANDFVVTKYKMAGNIVNARYDPDVILRDGGIVNMKDNSYEVYATDIPAGSGDGKYQGGWSGAGGGQGGGSGFSDGDGDPNSEQFRKLFVGGLNYDTTEDGLRAHFEQWGEIVDCVVIRDSFTKRSRGFGFVTFKDVSSIENAQSYRPHKIDNKEVETKRAMPRDYQGGGFGAGGGQGGGSGYSDDGGDPNSEQFRKLFVGGLSYETTEDSLRAHFEQWGEIVDCVVMRDPNTRRSRGFGFITYKDASNIEGVQSYRPHKVDNREVETKRAMPRGFQGGGFGAGRGRYSDDGGDPNSEQLKKLFVGGLSYETTEDSLRAHFEQWGEIVDCVVMRDPNTERSRGFGFVTYKDISSIEEAQSNRPHTIDNREVETKRAMPRDSRGAVNNDSVKKMFVGGLKDDTTEEQVRECFSPFGEIEHVDIAVDKATGKLRGFAFVIFKDYDSVDKAVLLKRHDLNTRKVEVKKAVSKDQMDSERGNGSVVRGGDPGRMGGGGGRPSDNFGSSGFGNYGASTGGYGSGYGAGQGWAATGGGYGGRGNGSVGRGGDPGRMGGGGGGPSPNNFGGSGFGAYGARSWGSGGGYGAGQGLPATGGGGGYGDYSGRGNGLDARGGESGKMGGGGGERSSDNFGSSGFGNYGAGTGGNNAGGYGSGFDANNSAWGGASAGGFGSNYAGDYGGGPVKEGGYSARAQGPYGAGAYGQTSNYGSGGGGGYRR